MTLADPPPRLRILTEDFYRMGEAGLFWGRNVILINGEVLDMPAEGSRHFTAIHKALKSLEKVYGEGFWVRRPGPLELARDTDPEPDLAVVRGKLEDYIDAHPTFAELVIEISETTQRYDRNFKLDLYAKAGIPEYWNVVLPDRELFVYRNPRVVNDVGIYDRPDIFRPGQFAWPPHAQTSVDAADLMV